MTLENTEDVSLDFALTHAVNLAEAGDTVQNKRIGTAHTRMVTTVMFILYNIGYLYCAEMMPQGHELQLMLVNTLRKVFASFAAGTEVALSWHFRISRAPIFRTYVSALKLSFAHLLRMPYLQCKIVCMTC